MSKRRSSKNRSFRVVKDQAKTCRPLPPGKAAAGTSDSGKEVPETAEATEKGREK